MRTNFIICLLLAATEAVHISTHGDQFASVKTEIEQGQRNAAQGVLGRQLGLTKVVNIKMHLHDLKKKITSDINQVPKLKDRKFDQSFSQISTEIKTFDSLIPKVEALEYDLELMDKSKGEKDQELKDDVLAMNKEMDKQKGVVQSLLQKEAKQKEDEEQKKLDAEYAYTPKQGFDWDSVSNGIEV